MPEENIVHPEPADAPPVTAGTASQPPEIAGPDRQVVSLEAALSEARKTLADREADYTALKSTLDSTIGAYRRLVIDTHPYYSDELITGSSVEEIHASMRKADELIAKMRSGLQAELGSLSVPAGAPARSETDASTLSPREKIVEGIRHHEK